MFFLAFADGQGKVYHNHSKGRNDMKSGKVKVTYRLSGGRKSLDNALYKDIIIVQTPFYIWILPGEQSRLSAQ